jgi:hypothetical protein
VKFFNYPSNRETDEIKNATEKLGRLESRKKLSRDTLYNSKLIFSEGGILD